MKDKPNNQYFESANSPLNRIILEYSKLTPKPVYAKARILMAEDREVDAIMRVSSLRAKGYDVDVAKDGVEAIQMLTEDDDYDAILMNIVMPRINGYRATEYIRIKLRYEKPIIGFSVVISEEHITEGMRCGMSDYVCSVLGNDEIINCLDRWLLRPQFRPTPRFNRSEAERMLAVDAANKAAEQVPKQAPALLSKTEGAVTEKAASSAPDQAPEKTPEPNPNVDVEVEVVSEE